jgi:hypothetical protein
MRIITLALGGLLAAGVLASAGTASAGTVSTITVATCVNGGGFPVAGICRGGTFNGYRVSGF